MLLKQLFKMHAYVVQDNHAQGVEDSIAAVYDWLQAQKQA